MLARLVYQRTLGSSCLPGLWGGGRNSFPKCGVRVGGGAAALPAFSCQGNWGSLFQGLRGTGSALPGLMRGGASSARPLYFNSWFNTWFNTWSTLGHTRPCGNNGQWCIIVPRAMDIGIDPSCGKIVLSNLLSPDVTMAQGDCTGPSNRQGGPR